MRITYINPYNLAMFFTYISLVVTGVVVLGDIFHFVGDILGSAAKLLKGPYRFDLLFISIIKKIILIIPLGWLTGFIAATLFNRFNKNGIEVQCDDEN